MALIIHRCTNPKCNHPDIFKRGEVCSYDQCAAGHHRLSPGPSEVIPTFDGMGAEITTITPPGSAWNGATTCACPDCKALYESLVGAA